MVRGPGSRRPGGAERLDIDLAATFAEIAVAPDRRPDAARCFPAYRLRRRLEAELPGRVAGVPTPFFMRAVASSAQFGDVWPGSRVWGGRDLHARWKYVEWGTGDRSYLMADPYDLSTSFVSAILLRSRYSGLFAQLMTCGSWLRV